MTFPNSSRPVSVQDIRQFTARETGDAKKAVAAAKIVRWYRAAQLEKCARARASMQRAYYKGIVRVTFIFWLRYSQILKASRMRSYRHVFDQWRAPLKETIASLRYYERALISRAFFLWRTDPGTRVCYIELLTNDRGPDFNIQQHLKMSKLRSILLFWRARQVLLKCLNIGLELSVSISMVVNKVPRSSISPIWQGYLFYLNSLSIRESTMFSKLSEKLLMRSFVSWKYNAVTILKEKRLKLRLREMELRLIRPFFKSWILFHRTRHYILGRAIFRWQLTLSVHIRHVEAARAAIELRKHAIKRTHFNNWARYIFARELFARHHCLEKIYGTAGIIGGNYDEGFVCSSWLKYALFFVHSLFDDYKLQVTAFRCLRKLKSAVDAHRYWKRLIVLAHGTYYISRVRLYLRAWAFVTFKMKTIEKKQRSFCATDDIVFQCVDIQMLHDKHNIELSCFESLLIMGVISKNNMIQPHRLAVLCKEDKHNCLLLMKMRRYISCQSDKTINCLYSGLCSGNSKDVMANVDYLLLRFAIVARANLGAYNTYCIDTYPSKRTLNLEDPVVYQQAMGLIQRNLAVRYNEFLSATDLLYSKLYTNGAQSSSERRILAYISGKFPHIRKTLTAGSVALLTTAFLLETPAIIFTDRMSVVSSSFLIQTWMGARQSYVPQQEGRACYDVLPQNITQKSISIVDSIYFTGLSRDFNEKGVAMLIPPNISPANNSISATERASLWAQLEVLKRKRFSVSGAAECWLLGAIASASERELQLAAIYRGGIYLKQASRRVVSLIRQPPTQLSSQDDHANDIHAEIDTESLDLIHLFQYTRSIPIDRFTTVITSTDATRVTVDEMKRLIETVRTSVVHPSLLPYINAKEPEGEVTSTVEITVQMDSTSLTRSLDEILELEKSVTSTTMRIIERSFNIAPLSHANAGSFCMLPDEQTINSPDVSFLQSSQLLSRSNSYVSPSFDHFSHTTAQRLKSSNSAKKTTYPDKLQVTSSRKKSKSKSGGPSKRNTAKRQKNELKQAIYKQGQNRMCRTAGASNKRKIQVHTPTDGDHSFYSDGSGASCCALSADSFHIHVLDDSPRCDQDQKRMTCDKNTHTSLITQRPHSSYYSSIIDGRLSSGRAFLGQLSSRPRTTVPYLTRRMNNSQRSSDTDSSDDIKLQEQHRAESATSYRSRTKQGRHIIKTNHYTDGSSMATAFPTTTTYIDMFLPAEKFIKAQLDSNLFTLSSLTRYQKSLLALHIWKRSAQCQVYILSEPTMPFPETDIRLYALSSGRAILSLDTIIDTILYDNIMFLHDNEDPDKIFQEIWLTDPQFTDMSAAENNTPTVPVVRLHFTKFWNYIKALSDEYTYELVYEGDHALGDKALRSIRSAPVFYGRMLRCSLVETANLVNSVAEPASSHLLYRASFLSSARSRSGTATFSQMTLDDLSAGLAFRQGSYSGSLPIKPTTAAPCIFLPRSQRTGTSNFISPRMNSSRLSPRIVYSVVNMSLCNDNTVTISVSSPRPWSQGRPGSLADSFVDESSLHLVSQLHSWTDKGHISYTPKMARLTLDKDSSSLQGTSHYLRSSSVPLIMTIPQPLGQLAINESLLTVKVEAESPANAKEIKPFLVSNRVTGRFTTTIHKRKEIQSAGAGRIYSGKIGGLAYSESREVLLSRPSSKSTVDKSRLLNGILSNHNVSSLTSLDDALDPKLRSTSNSTNTSIYNTAEEDIESSWNHEEPGSFKNLRNSLVIQGYGDACFIEQNRNNVCNHYGHARATSSPQLSPCVGSPGYATRRVAKIGSMYPSTASSSEDPIKIKCLGITSTSIQDQICTYGQTYTYQPRISKSAQQDRSPKRPSSGLKVFCSSPQIQQYKINDIRNARKQNKILTDYINQLPRHDILIEKVGPAIPSFSTQVSNEEDFDILDFPLGDIAETYKHSNHNDELSSIQLNLADPEDRHYKAGHDHESTPLSPNLEVMSVISNQAAEGTAVEILPSRYSRTEEQIHRILHKDSQDTAYCTTMNALKRDQIVLNAKQDYKHCLFNKSVNFKQKTFNSILRPREIDEQYEEMRDKLKSRVGSRAPSRLSSRGNVCIDHSSSPLLPLHTSPGRRRENLLVITMDPPAQAESTTDTTESTSIGIRINEQLFGINRVY